MNAKATFFALLAGLAMTIPASADRVTVYRDRDHDGHYNRKTYDTHRHYYRHYPRGRYIYRSYGAPYYRPYYYRNYRPYYHYRSRPTFYFGFGI